LDNFVEENFKGGDKVMVEFGVNVFVIGAAGYSLWILRRRKAMLRRQALRQRKVRKHLEEK